MNIDTRSEYTKKYGKASVIYQAKRRIQIKKECIEELGGKCIFCNYNKSIWALDFHHINPSNKIMDVGVLINKGSSIKRIKEELKKCILICCRCHRELHEGLLSLPEAFPTN